MKVFRLIVFLCFVAGGVLGASFPGSAYLQVTDSTGALSASNNTMTVSCWVKLSIPSDKTISKHQTILVDRKTGNESSTYSYLIRYNINTGNIEFLSKGTSALPAIALVERPFLDRWYHIAVVRDGTQFIPYIDGLPLQAVSHDVGSTVNTDGVTIGGGWNSTEFHGEIQEVAIYQNALSGTLIRNRMYDDQSGNASIVGYYKLGYSANSADHFKNFAANPPAGTSPAIKTGSGDITFEESDKGGEQSRFDSMKNNGEDAIAPLSGAFTWNRAVFSRPVPGISLDFEMAYSSGNAFSSSSIGSFNPFENPPLGAGWRHSFQTRMARTQSSSERKIITWQGNIETWELTNSVYKTQHKEYRGKLERKPDGHFEWITPDRLIYRFYDPTLGEIEDGLLYEISDFNSNTVQLAWDISEGSLTQVVDTVGGKYDFSYDSGNRVTNVSFSGWSANFKYNAENRLEDHWTTSPAGYTQVNTHWKFYYNATSKLLERIEDPRTNNLVRITYDKYGRMTETKNALDETDKTEFGVPAKRQITRTDAENNKWIETYDRKGRVIESKDPLGNTSHAEYDKRGNVVVDTDAMGYKTFYGYDERSNRTATTNALGEVTRWVYHSFFNVPVEDINPLGWSNHYTYDAAGNLLTHTDDLGTLATYTYFTNGLVKTSTDGNGNTSSFEYTSDGFLAEQTDPESNETTYAYNEWGWPTSITNALSEVVRSEYDINGNVVKTVDAINREITAVYDPNSNPVSQTDAKGQTTRNVYDAANRKIETTDRSGAKWKTTYNKLGMVLTNVDPLGKGTTNTYDEATRLIKVTDALGSTNEYQYDANGNRLATIDKLGRHWPNTYDRLNRKITFSDPFGNTQKTTYDRAGRIKTVRKPKADCISVNEYDGRGRLTKWIDPGGYTWIYDYDDSDNITNITDTLGGHYVMTYGSRNERLSELNQDGFLWSYEYDELLRLEQQTDPNSLIKTLTYDSVGRPVEINYSSGRIDSLSYDENDNVEVASRSGSGPATITLIDYDEMDRIIEVKDTFNNRIKYGYDSRGANTSLTYPGNKVLTQEFDAIGRMTKQIDWGGRTMSYDYDKAGRLISKTFPNGVIQTNSFDVAGRITSLSHSTPGSQPQAIHIALSYAYDANGNKTETTEKGTLDWPLPSKIDETATYTAANRLIDRTDALNPSNNFTYSYDDTGNMTNCSNSSESFTLTYDEDNRVTTVDWDGGITSKNIENRYDILGRRIERNMDGNSTRYILNLVGDMERILCDQNSSGQVTVWYIHGADLCYKVDATNALTCYHADAQANVVALSDSIGNTTSKYAYTPYGRSLPDSSTDYNPYRFVGSQGCMEELPNLYFMRARYYSAEAGVFLSTDPVKPIEPSWRPVAYRYSYGNPIVLSDPKGTSALITGNIEAEFNENSCVINNSTPEQRREGVAKMISFSTHAAPGFKQPLIAISDNMWFGYNPPEIDLLDPSTWQSRLAYDASYKFVEGMDWLHDNGITANANNKITGSTAAIDQMQNSGNYSDQRSAIEYWKKYFAANNTNPDGASIGDGNSTSSQAGSRSRPMNLGDIPQLANKSSWGYALQFVQLSNLETSKVPVRSGNSSTGSTSGGGGGSGGGSGGSHSAPVVVSAGGSYNGTPSFWSGIKNDRY